MNTQLPIRDNARQLEAESERFFRERLPPEWTCEKPADDYGVDLRVGVVEGNQVTGIELLVQLKASSMSNSKAHESVKLAVSTFNYLKKQLCVAMLVKYVAPEHEAYYILFGEIQAPPRMQKTFTVRITKANRLSTLDWRTVSDRLHSIQSRKLSAGQGEGGIE